MRVYTGSLKSEEREFIPSFLGVQLRVFQESLVRYRLDYWIVEIVKDYKQI